MNQVQQEYEDCKMFDMEQKLQPMYQWFLRPGKCWFHDKLAESAPIPDHYIQLGALLGFLNVCSVVFRIHRDQSLRLCGQQSHHHHQRHVNAEPSHTIIFDLEVTVSWLLDCHLKVLHGLV